MSKRHILFVVIVLVVFSGLIGFNVIKSYLTRKFLETYKPPAPVVSSVIAKKEAWTPMLEAVGKVVAIKGVDVNTEASGTITGIHFKSGQFIKKDALLVDIDDSVDVAELANYEANLALAKITFIRQADLLKKGATSSSDYDKAKANEQIAAANVQKSKAQIKQKHISAPFAGKLGIRLVNLGQYLSPGTNIVSLQSLDPLFIQFYQPGHRINQLQKGQTILFTTDAMPNYTFTGKITALNSEISTKTNNLLVQATVSNCSKKALASNDPKFVSTQKIAGSSRDITICHTKENIKQGVTDYAFLPGLFTRVNVLLPAIKDAVVVPTNAVSYSLYGNSIYVVKKSKDGKTLTANSNFVRTGDERDGQVVVLKGINAGDEVVNSGQLKLSNGTDIEINNQITLDDKTPIDKLGE
jgi:membrane fusion protein (multidrug efflux system)